MPVNLRYLHFSHISPDKLGLLAGVFFPSLYDNVTVYGVYLYAVTNEACSLAGDKGGAGTEEGISNLQ